MTRLLPLIRLVGMRLMRTLISAVMSYAAGTDTVIYINLLFGAYVSPLSKPVFPE